MTRGNESRYNERSNPLSKRHRRSNESKRWVRYKPKLLPPPFLPFPSPAERWSRQPISAANFPWENHMVGHRYRMVWSPYRWTRQAVGSR